MPLQDPDAWSKRVGGDVAHARIVTEEGAPEAAAALSARAFTVGARIFFAAGNDAATDGGDLLAHELAHVVQQGAAAPPASWNQLEVVEPDDARETTAQAHAGTPAGGIAIARDLDPEVALWFRDHLLVTNQDIQSIDKLPQPLQDKVRTEVIRRYGREYVRRGMANQLVDQDPPDQAAAEPLTAEEYWQKHGPRTLTDVMRRAMAELQFEIVGPGLQFSPDERGPFLLHSLGWRLNESRVDVVTQLLDTPLLPLIDNVRVLDDRDRAPDAYEPGVTGRVLERLGTQVRRATERLSTPYARARMRAVEKARADSQTDFIGPRQLGPPFDLAPWDLDTSAIQPSPRELGARTTIEHAIAESLCEANVVAFDPSAFAVSPVAITPGLEAEGEPRPVQLELVRGNGDWMMVEVIGDASASAADVANELYGNPQFAHLVVGSGSRYAFVFPPSGCLADKYDIAWANRQLIDEGVSPLEMYWRRHAPDPIVKLDQQTAEQRALDSAKGQPVDGAGAAPVLQRFAIMESLLEGIVRASIPLGVGDFVAPMQATIAARRAACAADPAEAEKWAAHSSVQLDLFSETKQGLAAITEQMFAMGLPAVSTEHGEELVGDVTGSMQGPTHELAAAYAAVVVASDQLDIGRERLAIAKERLAAYPFDMVDRMLAVIRKRIDGTRRSNLQHSIDKQRLDSLYTEISETVGHLRIAVVNGDGTAAMRLQALRSQISMLDLQSSIGGMIGGILELEDQLLRSESMSPDWHRRDRISERLWAALEPWKLLATQYDEAWQAGHEQDPAWLAHIRTQVEQLRVTTELPALIQLVVSFAEDEAERQRWIAIGIMIGAALIAAVSGGLASGAIGGVAGMIVGAGMEGLTFTAITSTLNQDQTYGGFMAELGLNVITFGGLRAISGGAKLLAAGRALTAGEKLAEMTIEGLWMVASAKAHERIQEIFAKGGTVTTQSAASIFGQEMLASFASRVLGRVAGKFLGGAKGLEKVKEVEHALLLRGDAEALALLAKNGDESIAEALVAADTKSLKADAEAMTRVHDLASDPVEAARHGITLDAGELDKLNAAATAATREVTEREIAELMDRTTQHADHVVAEPGVYSELVHKHRSQGSHVVESLDANGHPQASITPQRADGTVGAAFQLHTRTGADVEQLLAQKNLPNDGLISDYLAKRADDPAGAVADLGKVNTQAELDALLEKTLGKDAVAARRADLAAHAAGQQGTAPAPVPRPPPTSRVVTVEEQLVLDAFKDRSLTPSTVSQLAQIPNVTRALLQDLATHDVAVAEQLGNALKQTGSWSDKAREGLAKLAASGSPDARRMFPQVAAGIDISGMDAWVKLASRQLHDRVRLGDLEASLTKALEIRAFDSSVAVEVNYYNGKPISKADLDALRATPGFDKNLHTNLDVESAAERWEMKRVDPDLSDVKKVADQVSGGVNKFIATNVPSKARGGAKTNIVDVEYGDKIKVPGFDEAQLRDRIQRYLKANSKAADFVDEVRVRAELGGKLVAITVMP